MGNVIRETSRKYTLKAFTKDPICYFTPEKCGLAEDSSSDESETDTLDRSSSGRFGRHVLLKSYESIVQKDVPESHTDEVFNLNRFQLESSSLESIEKLEGELITRHFVIRNILLSRDSDGIPVTEFIDKIGIKNISTYYLSIHFLYELLETIFTEIWKSYTTEEETEFYQVRVLFEMGQRNQFTLWEPITLSYIRHLFFMFDNSVSGCLNFDDLCAALELVGNEDLLAERRAVYKRLGSIELTFENLAHVLYFYDDTKKLTEEIKEQAEYAYFLLTMEMNLTLAVIFC